MIRVRAFRASDAEGRCDAPEVQGTCWYDEQGQWVAECFGGWADSGYTFAGVAADMGEEPGPEELLADERCAAIAQGDAEDLVASSFRAMHAELRDMLRTWPGEWGELANADRLLWLRPRRL